MDLGLILIMSAICFVAVLITLFIFRPLNNGYDFFKRAK